MRLLVLFVFCCSSLWASAQIVNIERQRFTDTTKAISGNVNVSGSAIKNTSTLTQISGNTRLQILSEKDVWLILGSTDFVASAGANLLNNGFMHIRLTRYKDYKPKVSWEFFQQAQYNQIQKIRYRYIIGGGGRLQLINTDSLSFNGGASLFYEHEMLTQELGVSNDLRASFYAIFDWKPTKQMQLSSVLYYQPVLYRLNDSRLTTQTELRVKFAKHFQFVSSLNLVYDSRPPIGIPRTIYQFRNGLGYQF